MRHVFLLFALACALLPRAAIAAEPTPDAPIKVPELDATKSMLLVEPPSDSVADVGMRLRLWDGRYQVSSWVTATIGSDELTLTNFVHLALDRGVPREAIAYMKKRIQRSVAEHLDNRLELIGRESGKRRALRMRVAFLDEPPPVRKSKALVMRISARGRENAERLNVHSSTQVIAHEFAHRMLLALDEYADDTRASPTIDRRYLASYRRASLMQNTTPQRGPRLLPRHARLAMHVATELTGGERHIVTFRSPR